MKKIITKLSNIVLIIRIWFKLLPFTGSNFRFFLHPIYGEWIGSKWEIIDYYIGINYYLESSDVYITKLSEGKSILADIDKKLGKSKVGKMVKKRNKLERKYY